MATVPAKAIIEPHSSTLKVGQDCKVQWKEGKKVEVLQATTLAMGKEGVCVHVSTKLLFVCLSSVKC